MTCRMAVDNRICSPITKLSDVLEWTRVNDSWAIWVRDLEPRTEYSCQGYGRESKRSFSYSSKYSGTVPKTLVCHDMKGGYLEDRYVGGSTSHDEYRFFHWAGIDSFVYFSHYLVTVPPLAWINSGHLHGVPVLGTVITEWKAGKEVWLELASDENKLLLFSSKLAEVCDHYKFDGYLLNIENEIPAEHIDSLVKFVTQLKSDLKTICKHETLLIWYDSVVTPTGKLDWQNKLNDKNRSFFNACDGIFLNYCWTEDGLRESIENAGERVKDVFVGVDVFGRGCYGDGKFNTNKALYVIRSLGMSAAIFAPGWVHETKPENEEFLKREYTFWNKLWPYLHAHGPTKLPFSTSFCQGFGQRIYKNGQVVHDTPWYNLSLQQYQPSACICTCEDEECLDYNQRISCVSFYHQDAFEGGGCLKIFPCSDSHNCLFHRQRNEDIIVSFLSAKFFALNPLTGRQENNKTKLFICDFSSTNASAFLVTLGVKCLDNKGCLDFIVLMEDTLQRADDSGSDDSGIDTDNTEKATDSSNIVSVTVVNKDFKTFVEHQPQFSSSLSGNWELRSFRIHNSSGIMTSRIVELGVIPSEDMKAVLCGYLKIEAVPGTDSIK